MGLAHEVVREETDDPNVLSYQGASPDEITLVETAVERGLTFQNYSNGVSTVDIATQIVPRDKMSKNQKPSSN